MKELSEEIPFIAKSLSGHDKGKTYVAIGFKEGRVLLADGRQKTISRPKKKNPLHIQAEVNTPAVKRLREFSNILDSDIIYFLKTV